MLIKWYVLMKMALDPPSCNLTQAAFKGLSSYHGFTLVAKGVQTSRTEQVNGFVVLHIWWLYTHYWNVNPSVIEIKMIYIVVLCCALHETVVHKLWMLFGCVLITSEWCYVFQPGSGTGWFVHSSYTLWEFMLCEIVPGIWNIFNENDSNCHICFAW